MNSSSSSRLLDDLASSSSRVMLAIETLCPGNVTWKMPSSPRSWVTQTGPLKNIFFDFSIFSLSDVWSSVFLEFPSFSCSLALSVCSFTFSVCLSIGTLTLVPLYIFTGLGFSKYLRALFVLALICSSSEYVSFGLYNVSGKSDLPGNGRPPIGRKPIFLIGEQNSDAEEHRDGSFLGELSSPLDLWSNSISILLQPSDLIIAFIRWSSILIMSHSKSDDKVLVLILLLTSSWRGLNHDGSRQGSQKLDTDELTDILLLLLSMFLYPSCNTFTSSMLGETGGHEPFFGHPLWVLYGEYCCENDCPMPRLLPNRGEGPGYWDKWELGGTGRPVNGLEPNESR